MSRNDSAFAGSIPEIYGRYMAPMLFEPYAADLAERLRNVTAGHLLEIAAGTGALTRALRRTLPEAVAIVATDLNQPMLDFAAAQSDSAPIRWQQADATHLPFPDSAFDIVVCQFGVMFFPDKVAAYREVYRVLKPAGRFVFNVWDRIEENELALAAHEALKTFFPDNPPQFLPRAPYGYHDCQRIEEALRTTGFLRIEAEVKQLRSHTPSAHDAAFGFCHGTPLRNEIEERIPGRLAEATEATQSTIAARLGSGTIEAKMQAVVFMAAK